MEQVPAVRESTSVPADVEPVRVTCGSCERDITGRCSAAIGPNGEILFVTQPLKCPLCGRPLIFRRAKSLVIRP